MFVDAIEQVAGYTRALHTITRTYESKHIIPGSGTLFFVNELGYAVTCKHIVELIGASDNINLQYQHFKNERAQIPNNGKWKTQLRGLEMKFKYHADAMIQIKNSFIDCVDKMTGATWHIHPTLDLAIIKFEGFENKLYNGYARFKKNPSLVKQGQFLCRLGFPFPEFNNFRYNQQTDDIEWIKEGVQVSPRFPIEGMITRFLAEEQQLYGIELSTPGLRGQSGGPLFDDKGIVYGMQFSTKHLHLGFDMIDKEVMLPNGVKKVTDYSFLHLGQCIHAEAIKHFLMQHGVKYYEED